MLAESKNALSMPKCCWNAESIAIGGTALLNRIQGSESSVCFYLMVSQKAELCPLLSKQILELQLHELAGSTCLHLGTKNTHGPAPFFPAEFNVEH